MIFNEDDRWLNAVYGEFSDQLIDYLYENKEIKFEGNRNAACAHCGETINVPIVAPTTIPLATCRHCNRGVMLIIGHLLPIHMNVIHTGTLNDQIFAMTQSIMRVLSARIRDRYKDHNSVTSIVYERVGRLLRGLDIKGPESSILDEVPDGF
jgi:hypothetical protein